MQAPRDIPYKMLNQFTMGGVARIEYRYLNDCSEETQGLINKNFTKEIFLSSLERVKNREHNYYGPTDGWLYEALAKYPINDKDICIMGSTYPWYEAIAIAHGVKNCTVIEYSKREAFHENIMYKQPHEISDPQQKFDVCFSISSYEHDGLGRYGDPLNPDGDCEAMENTKSLLHKGGLLYLAVPLGIDKVVFNAHRVYGKHRIQKLLSGWDVVDKLGFFEQTFTNDMNGIDGSPYQPIYVLRNR